MSARQNYGMMGVVLALVGVLVLASAAFDRDRGGDTLLVPADVATDAETATGTDTSSGIDDPTGTPDTTVSTELPPLPAADDCTIAGTLREGSASDEVACLQAALVSQGYLDRSAVEPDFGAATADAVRRFQTDSSLVVDAVAGRHTLNALGVWEGPPPADASTCVDAGRSIVVDREFQRAWFCEDGTIRNQIPITSAWSQPDPGRYKVYAKDRDASSSLTANYVTMTHFVAFTYGKVSGARIAFHSVPTYTNGNYAQPLSSVGDLGQRGDSEGCIRVLPDDAVKIWDWISTGDEVLVIT